MPSETKKTIKAIDIQGGLYSQVAIIWCSIMNIKVMKEYLVKDKEKNNETPMKSHIQDDKDKDCYPVDEKIGKRPSGATDVSRNKKNKSSKVSEVRYIFQGQSAGSKHWFNIDPEWIETIL